MCTESSSPHPPNIVIHVLTKPFLCPQLEINNRDFYGTVRLCDDSSCSDYLDIQVTQNGVHTAGRGFNYDVTETKTAVTDREFDITITYANGPGLQDESNKDRQEIY